MNQQKILQSDPFCSVDDSYEPEKLEYILLDKIEGYYKPIIDWFFDCFLKYIHPHAVLEVGSGTGHLLQRLADRVGLEGKNLQGVDRSTFLTERAKQRFPELSFSRADGEVLPFDASQFDIAYIATVLAHVENPIVIVHEMARVVRSGGIVDIEFDPDFFQRMRDAVIKKGFPENKATIWDEEICTAASCGEFFFSRNFYCALGRVGSV